MIRVNIYRSTGDNTIRSFSVEGHADFDEHGKDIVCAGVSAVTIGTMNAIEKLIGIIPQAEVKNGLLRARFTDRLPAETEEKIQLLLEAMVVTLQSIEQSYSTYIQIHFHKQRREN
ncbi:ribosomal-processing cysteine protease Prp [Paenibacillus senegalensis]|uniref:ribosomal-processing cysteine protease Prp n=1 Tax=Paenibacillus senegalensis TaxID=1465766 RepID=UPI000289BBD8|nr:ribosomal-processing cysteine protease Prp [Paenibacillus senegalensis]